MLKYLFGSKDEGKLQPGEEELIGTRFFGEEDFEDVPPWIQWQIKKIDAKGLGDSPEELTHELVGKTFIYRLDFDGPNGEILGVYRKLKDNKSKPLSSKPSKPQWKLLGKGGRDNDGSERIYGPPWIKKFIRNIIDNSGGSPGDGVYHLKGKRYRYKVIIEYLGHGGWRADTYRRQRTWYWKKLNS